MATPNFGELGGHAAAMDVAAGSSISESDDARPGRICPDGSPASTEFSATMTRGSGAVAGTVGSAPVRFGLFSTVWPQAARSRALKPMLVAQIMWKICWFTLCSVRAFARGEARVLAARLAAAGLLELARAARRRIHVARVAEDRVGVRELRVAVEVA